jgi:hypothetical protein
MNYNAAPPRPMLVSIVYGSIPARVYAAGMLLF